MDPPEPTPAKQLLRSFSDDLCRERPGDSLSRGLRTHLTVERHRQEQSVALSQEWNMFLTEGRELALSSMPDEEAVLLKQSQVLYQAWTKFCKQLPQEQRRDLSDKKPSIKFLYESIAKASVTWNNDRGGTTSGHLKSVFTKLCNTVDSHSNLVSMLPTNDKYVTLLTGSLSAVAQASMNHRELADGVSATLEDLGEDMAYWNSLMEPHSDRRPMQRYIIELYTVVFEFLTEIFSQWSKSSWKRFLTSFDENAFQRLFNDKRQRIKAIEGRMKRQADMLFQSEMRDLKQQVGSQGELLKQQNHMLSTLSDFYQAQRGNAEGNVHVQEVAFKLMKQLGVNMEELLKHNYQAKLISQPSLAGVTTTSGHQESLETTSPNLDPHEDITMPFSQVTITSEARTVSSVLNEDNDIPHRDLVHIRAILDILEPLATRFGKDIQKLIRLTSTATWVNINNRCKNRIQGWTRSRDTDMIWIGGPYDVSHPSQNTLTAACLVALPTNSKISCLSYFCSLKVHAEPGRHQPRSKILLDMIKSFIIQLLLLTKDDDRTLAIPLSRFEQLLDPQGGDLDATLSLFHDLREIVPMYMHCVIDGIQVLEDMGDRLHKRNLARVLREITNMHHSDASEDQRVIKLCFTTDGHVDALAKLARNNVLEKISYGAESEEHDAEESSSLMSL
ncbi:hypothetical protein F4778DRAFT_62818 [Xylariomycetidae sp. FL2044]|nr:hypothetical protein F4778DRAFT_62818 [Xylariomycetidae sp. FL2044]